MIESDISADTLLTTVMSKIKPIEIYIMFSVRENLNEKKFDENEESPSTDGLLYASLLIELPEMIHNLYAENW
jgi:hypothetical protein